jgi:hypothetical protein
MTGRPRDPALSVLNQTLADLRREDFSPGLGRFREWPEFRYHRVDADRVGILTFDEALAALPSDIPKLIELKDDSTKSSGRAQEMVDTALATLRAHGAVDVSVLYSMDAQVVKILRKQAPEVRVCAFDYKKPLIEQLPLMRSLHADGLVVQLRDVLDDELTLTSFGRELQADFDAQRIRVGAVLYPYRGSGIPWILTAAELAVLRTLDFVWSCASDSMIEVEHLARTLGPEVVVPFDGADVDTARVTFGYAKRNASCHVFQDDGVHVRLDPPAKTQPADSDGPMDERVRRLERQMRYALETFPYYAGGGVGLKRPLQGDFVAEVEYSLSAPLAQAITLEMAAIRVDPGEHQPPWAADGSRAPIGDLDSFFDPHGAPPYVGVEHDENDGYRINWNLGTQYENNRYGRPVGDGATPTEGRLRLERRGAHFAAYYRNEVDAPDWVCVGGLQNDHLRGRVYLRCVAKRWLQRQPDGPDGYAPIAANEIVFRNLHVRQFR